MTHLRLASAPSRAIFETPQLLRVCGAVALLAFSASAFAPQQFAVLGRLGFPSGIQSPRSVSLGDVDQDGDVDVVVANYNQQSRLYVNDGAGLLADATLARVPAAAYPSTCSALGDVDADGDLDLVLGGAFDQLRLYLNNGTGTFSDATASRVPAGTYVTHDVSLSDVDRDADLDLIFGHGGQARLFLNNGAGSFTDATAARFPVSGGGAAILTAVGVGDLDRDGDLDLVLGIHELSAAGGQSLLYVNNGNGFFSDATASRLVIGRHHTTSLALGDVDGDRDLDLAMSNSNFGAAEQSRLYLNDGLGVFSDVTASRLALTPRASSAIGFGDVDGDGDLDLVLGNSGERPVLGLNDGTGTFSDATATRMPSLSSTTAYHELGDLDRDGDLDLIVSDAGQLLLGQNLSRQLHAPQVLRVGQSYRLDVYSRYGPTTTSEIALPFASTATADLPLGPLGTLGIDPTRMIALPPFVVAQPAGIGSLFFPVPNLPNFGGISIYTQAVLQQQPVQDRLTNVISDVLLQ
ncbi:MAG: VCBS repeat-containing protein [Planctomycetes bacterium]|nr:VCBS repeat-containing protein [Planctomycetota bacterium]